ncbi:MAG: chloramphenicol acetyltransferase [Candidatus Promineifilaceae bacterium]
MRQIDLQTWSRREHFKTFGKYDHPHFNICANVDLTRFYPIVRRRGISFTATIVYILTRTANSIPEFRYRIRGQGVIEHETVHPSFTVLLDGDVFSFCSVNYTEDFPLFAERVSERIAYVREHPIVTDEPGKDDQLFMSAMPWVSFTSVMHPLHMNPPDSVPRIAWGKFFEEGLILKMPLSVQAHHALLDGIHLGKYYSLVQEYLDHPEDLFVDG